MEIDNLENLEIIHLFEPILDLVFSIKSLDIVIKIHNDKDKPKKSITGPSNKKNIIKTRQTVMKINFIIFFKVNSSELYFQFKLTLIPLKYMAGIINGRKTI